MKIMKMLALFLCISAIMVSTCLPIYAGEEPAATNSPLIDTNRKGSLTLYKLRENDGNVTDGDGLPGGAGGRFGMEGIGFSILKIGEFETVMSEDTSIQSSTSSGVDQKITIGNYYKELDPGFIQLFERNNINVSCTEVSGIKYYSSEDLSSALISLCSIGNTEPGEVQINNYVKDNTNRIDLALTDADGKTTQMGLDQGLYLVAETNYSNYKKSIQQLSGDTYATEHIVNPSSPFLVSLPMSNRGENLSTFWQYDVTAYPKNQTVSIIKHIVKQSDNETLVQREDFEIGEVFHEVITASAPAVAKLLQEDVNNRVYTHYIIQDVMDDGLSIVKVNSVKIGIPVASPEKISDFREFEELRQGHDYKVLQGISGDTELVEGAKGQTSFRIYFLPDGLSKLNALEEGRQIYVNFDVLLNGVASAGEAEANANTPVLQVKFNNTMQNSINGNQTNIYSYRLQMLKKGVTDFSNVKFRISRQTYSNANGVNETQFVDVQFMKDRNGMYHVFDSLNDNINDAVDIISPGSNGQLAIRGLDANTYEITEISTESGRELLKSKFQVQLEGKNPIDGNLESATLISDGKTTQLAVQKGKAGLTVKNFKSLILRTGGSGGFLLLVGAAVAIAVFGVLILILRRRRGI